MPPKIKITKEDIIDAAVCIVRNYGAGAINTRAIASHLNCSTQPVFSNFANTDQLRLAVAEKADALCQAYMCNEVATGNYPPYKAYGMAYIRFAKEEKELFQLLYMRDRSNETTPVESDITNKMEAIICDNTGLCNDAARLFHLEMWAYVHGIAAMFATGYLDLDWALVSKMLTDAYQGLQKQHTKE